MVQIFRKRACEIAVGVAVLAMFIGSLSYLSQLSGDNPLSAQSKAELVEETQDLIEQIEDLEATAGTKEAAGYRIYSADTTGKLWSLYREAQERVNLLNTGKVAAGDGIDDYLLSAEPLENPYQVEQVREAMDTLLDRIPEDFFKDYRIYLAPLAVSGVSGQGGPGFSLIYAISDTFQPTETDLRVTLYHEAGHHIQLGRMPAGTKRGKELWAEYHQFRGGSWKVAGKANTVAWSESSEETFAEDFRMIFGEDQPYFGDMALGDPRDDSEVISRFEQFVLELAEEEPVDYQSPWVPDGFAFWQYQPVIIMGLWLFLLGLLGLTRARSRARIAVPYMGMEA